MTSYSHSRLSEYEQCPLKYKYHRIDGIKPEENSIEAFMGSRFHDVMEKVYAERDFKKSTVDNLEQEFNKLWEKNWGDHIFIVRNDRTAEDYRQIGLKALREYHKRYYPFDEGRVHGIERKVYAKLDEKGDYTVFGLIDRLMEIEDGCFEIHDYKTAGTLPEQSYLDADRQLALYEIAIRQMWPNDVKKVELVWHYVIHDKTLRSKRTSDQLEELKKSTIALIDEIEAAEEHPPHETSLCRWCTYQSICPLFAHKFRTDDLPKEQFISDGGVSLVNQITVLEARKGELKAEIKAIELEEEPLKQAAISYAEKEGLTRLMGSDKQLNIKEDIKVNYPKSGDKNRADFEAALQAAGFWKSVSKRSFQWNELKKLAKSEKWIEAVPAALQEFVTVSMEKTARLLKRKDIEEE